MGVYYPQAALILNVRWEDFGDTSNPVLQQAHNLRVLAKKVTVNINDYTQADTFEAEIDFKQFPFDPRCIRACGVQIHMENVGEIFARSNGLSGLRPSSENVIFSGFADEESISFDDTSRTVRFEGRDFTSLLIDKKYIKGTVNLEQSVDVVISQILGELPELANFKVEKRTNGPLPVLASLSPDKNELSGKKNVKRDETYWDVIQDIAARAGLIVYCEIDKLVLTQPRALYDEKATKRFVYGKNLSKLEFKRKLGRKKNFNIVVRCLNIESKEVLEAKIPAEATDAWTVATGIPNKEVKLLDVDKDGNAVPEDAAKVAPYIAFLLNNISNKDHLIKVGEQIYEEIGRQQIEGEFETKEMETAGTDNKVFDLLKLRNGTPVSIEIDPEDLREASAKASLEQRQKFLKGRGYDTKVARGLAESIGRSASPFYTKSVSLTMDEQQGFSCKVDFINFINLSKSLTGGA